MLRLKEWLAPATIIVLAGGICWLGYVVVYRMPDIEKKLEGIETAQQKTLGDIQTEQRERFRSIDAQLLGMRTNLLRLCARHGRLEKDCELKEIVSVASEVSAAQAEVITSARVSGLDGHTPQLVSDQAAAALSTIAQFPSGQTIQANDQIASAMVWASAAKEASWKATGGELQVNFSNGNAVFTMDGSVSPADLSRSAEILNDLSASFSSSAKAIWLVDKQKDPAQQSNEIAPPDIR